MNGYSLEKRAKFEEVKVGDRQVRFPVEYNDQLNISANYTISSEKARQVLPSKRLEPIEIKPGVAILALEAYEYHKIYKLIPYNEFGAFIPVNYRRDDGTLSEPGTYCYHLPVTTEMARWAGVEVYGFPKIIADIEFQYRGKSTSCVVWQDGETIAKLTVKKIETKMRAGKSICYTYKDGNILKTLVESEGLVGVGHEVDGAKLELGKHRISDDLRALKIGPEPIEYGYVQKKYMLLHKPSEKLKA
jgi:hypothetical protein